MEKLLKSTLVFLVVAFQLAIVSSAPIRISRHVPYDQTRQEELPPSKQHLKVMQPKDIEDLPPPREPIKILRSTEHDVIIQISRSPGSYLKNETIRLQITNGEVISSKERSDVSSKEDSVQVKYSSSDGAIKEQSVEVHFADSDQAKEDFISDASQRGAMKGKRKDKKNLGGESFAWENANGTLAKKIAVKSGRRHAEKSLNSSSSFVRDASRIDADAEVASAEVKHNETLQSILFPKSLNEKSNLNQISKQKFANNPHGPPTSIRKGLLLKEIQVDGLKHSKLGAFHDDDPAHADKTVHTRSLRDNKLLDNVINSAVSSIANRKSAGLLQRQALRGASGNQMPPSTSSLLGNMRQSQFAAAPPVEAAPVALFNPLRRAERLETTFDGLDRLVNALSRIDYYISNSAKHVLTMLTHHHNTDYRMRNDAEKEAEGQRYFRSPVTTKPQHEKLYFLHN